MSRQTKNNIDCGTPLSEHILENYSGGVGSGLNDLTRVRVKCHAAGCNFECNTFAELNAHMRQAHPELC